MSYTYVLATAIGKVRLYAHDNVEADAYCSDEEITVLLSAVNNNVFLAAAALYRLKAGDKDYLSNNFRIGNYSESSEFAKDLLAAAESLEKKEEDKGIGLDGEYLGQEAIAEIGYTRDNFNQIIINKALRGETD